MLRSSGWTQLKTTAGVSPSMPVFHLGTSRPRFRVPRSRLDVTSDAIAGSSLVRSRRDLDARKRSRRGPRSKTGMLRFDTHGRLLGSCDPLVNASGPLCPASVSTHSSQTKTRTSAVRSSDAKSTQVLSEEPARTLQCRRSRYLPSCRRTP